MKKNLLAVLMIAALTLPVFATDKGVMEIDLKAGAVLNPSLNISAQGSAAPSYVGYNQEVSFSIAGEVYYFVKDNLGIGIGVNNVFESKAKAEEADIKIGYTNIYFGLKPKFDVENSFIDSVYLLGNVGYGIINASGDDISDMKLGNGLYWAIGAGAEINSFLVEFVYSVNYSTSKKDSMMSGTFSSVGINVGYKFSI